MAKYMATWLLYSNNCWHIINWCPISQIFSICNGKYVQYVKEWNGGITSCPKPKNFQRVCTIDHGRNQYLGYRWRTGFHRLLADSMRADKSVVYIIMTGEAPVGCVREMTPGNDWRHFLLSEVLAWTTNKLFKRAAFRPITQGCVQDISQERGWGAAMGESEVPNGNIHF